MPTPGGSAHVVPRHFRCGHSVVAVGAKARFGIARFQKAGNLNRTTQIGALFKLHYKRVEIIDTIELKRGVQRFVVALVKLTFPRKLPFGKVA